MRGPWKTSLFHRSLLLVCTGRSEAWGGSMVQMFTSVRHQNHQHPAENQHPAKTDPSAL